MGGVVGEEAVEEDLLRLLAHGERGLHGDVHDHQPLGAEAEGQDLEGVSDEQTRPGEGVEEVEEPDEGDLGDAGAGVLLVGVFVDGGSSGAGGLVGWG